MTSIVSKDRDGKMVVGFDPAIGKDMTIRIVPENRTRLFTQEMIEKMAAQIAKDVKIGRSSIFSSIPKEPAKGIVHKWGDEFGTILQYRSRAVPLTGAHGMVVGPARDPLRVSVLVLDGDREGTIQDVLRNEWL